MGRIADGIVWRVPWGVRVARVKQEWRGFAWMVGRVAVLAVLAVGGGWLVTSVVGRLTLDMAERAWFVWLIMGFVVFGMVLMGVVTGLSGTCRIDPRGIFTPVYQLRWERVVAVRVEGSEQVDGLRQLRVLTKAGRAVVVALPEGEAEVAEVVARVPTGLMGAGWAEGKGAATLTGREAGAYAAVTVAYAAAVAAGMWWATGRLRGTGWGEAVAPVFTIVVMVGGPGTVTGLWFRGRGLAKDPAHWTAAIGANLAGLMLAVLIGAVAAVVWLWR